MKISVCLPCYSTTCEINWALCMIKQRWPEGAKVDIAKSKAMWVCNALNKMVALARKNWGPDWIVYMSNDAWWDYDAIKRLIGHDKQVVGGWASGRCYPFKCHAADYKDEKLNRYHPVENPQERKGLEKVVANGGELLVFRKDVFDKIPYPWFSGLGMIEPETGRMRTEDYFFAEQCKKHGIEIWVDWDVPVAHACDGVYMHKGRLMAE